MQCNLHICIEYSSPLRFVQPFTKQIVYESMAFNTKPPLPWPWNIHSSRKGGNKKFLGTRTNEAWNYFLILYAFKNYHNTVHRWWKRLTNITFVIISSSCCCFWQYFEVLQKSCSIFRLDFLEIYTIWTISSTFSPVSDKFWKAIKCSRARDFFSILFSLVTFQR